MRMSPNRGSPWVEPAAPNGSPASSTTPTFTSATSAHAWNARTIAACHADVGI